MIFGQFGDMVKQARELQSNLKKIKDELSQMRYQGEAGGVQVTVSGEMEVTEIKAPPNVNSNHIKDAANRALKLAKDDAANRLKGAAGGLNIPGLT